MKKKVLGDDEYANNDIYLFGTRSLMIKFLVSFFNRNRKSREKNNNYRIDLVDFKENFVVFFCLYICWVE